MNNLILDNFYSFGIDDWAFKYEFGYESLTHHFETKSLKGFGIEEQHLAISACGAIIHYLNETKHDKLKHINKISRIEEDKYVWLDKFTIRNLELYQTNHENGKSLIDIIDKTVSPMGSRLLKRWLALPLKNINAINERLNAVTFLVSDENKRIDFISFLKEIGDLERLISKVAALRVSPRELVHLKKSLVIISKLKSQIKTSNNSTLQSVAEQLNPCDIICERLQNELNEDAPISILKGNVFNKGINVELDELRNIAFNGKDYLLQIQKREIEKTGITSLKVAFNSVFGYYLEVTHLHKDKVPQDWIRKQTLTNAERYITPELKTYEEKILGAEEKIMSIEQELFEKLVNDISEYIAPIQLNANLLAKLDVLCGFATLSIENNYNCPKINEGFAIEIKEGRHPVIEKQLPIGINYVSNSVYLDNDNTQIMMITGPNMSGKSALLRQTALIVLLAQIGCYVPAEEANLSIIDKIFTRVGATDNMSSGESTFMVEMNETASILNNLSARSLVLLDEIGRGTSTYDGISIAWSIAEFIHNQPINRAKTLFATHYHELNDMASLFLRIKNYNVTIKESANKIIFLRKLAEGGSAHSFGIHVARMAGMPNYVVDRANEILKKLEKNRDFELESIDDLSVSGGMSITPQNNKDMQLSFFQLNDPILNKIKEDVLAIDINTLTPVEALLKLNEIKSLLNG